MAPKKVVLRFSTDIADKPIIYRLVKDYDLIINILKANVNPQKEGTMVLEVIGDLYAAGLDYLRHQGVVVQDLTQEIVRNETLCTDCGACTAICPTGALYLERPSMEVRFDSDACVVCYLCLKACPVRAMEARF
ncbi:MAG TPA: (Fe-S)-binding protein [Desulfotomaculum sp.]|nr:(Fe-S)-binding protein [Desulfotomaculum sp.]